MNDHSAGNSGGEATKEVMVAWSYTLEGAMNASTHLAKHGLAGRFGPDEKTWNSCVWVHADQVEEARRVLDSIDGGDMFFLADRLEPQGPPEPTVKDRVTAEVARDSGIRLAFLSLIVPPLSVFALIQLGIAVERGIGRRAGWRFYLAGLVALPLAFVSLFIAIDLIRWTMTGESLFFS